MVFLIAKYVRLLQSGSGYYQVVVVEAVRSVAIPRWALPQPSPHSPPVLCSGAGGRAPTIHSGNLERFSALWEKEIIMSNIIPADALNPKPSFKS